MKRLDRYEHLLEIFEKWYVNKEDEIMNTNEGVANSLYALLDISKEEFDKKYVKPFEELSPTLIPLMFDCLSYHLADKFSPFPYAIKYQIKHEMDPLPNALEWLLVQIKNLRLFEFSKELLEGYYEPYNQCIYCGKPDFYEIPPSDTKIYFNKKKRFCHTFVCHSVNISNTNAHHRKCHYRLWMRKKKTLLERLDKATVKRSKEIFIDFCEKQLKENLKIEYVIQREDTQGNKLVDFGFGQNLTNEDLFIKANH